MSELSYIMRLRQHVGHQKLLSPGVRAIIRDAEGRILLQRRSDFGTWGLPAGGLELDETLLAALAREVREETGLAVMRATAFAAYSNPAYSVTYPNGDQTQPVTLAFLVEEWHGEPQADGDETLQLAFFPPDRLPDAMHPPHRKTLLDFRSFLETGQFIVD